MGRSYAKTRLGEQAKCVTCMSKPFIDPQHSTLLYRVTEHTVCNRSVLKTPSPYNTRMHNSMHI